MNLQHQEYRAHLSYVVYPQFVDHMLLLKLLYRSVPFLNRQMKLYD